MDGLKKGGSSMDNARGKVYFSEDVCKGCGLCITACPQHILELDEKSINKKGYHPSGVVEPQRCTGCSNCAIICPDSVIKVERR